MMDRINGNAWLAHMMGVELAVVVDASNTVVEIDTNTERLEIDVGEHTDTNVNQLDNTTIDEAYIASNDTTESCLVFDKAIADR